MSSDNQSDDKTKHITFGFVIAWIFAIAVGVPGIMMLFEQKVVAGILFILAALVALPPANKFVKDRANISLSSGLRIALILVLFIGAGLSVTHGSTSLSAVTASIPAAPDNTVAAPEQATQQAAQQPAPAPQVLLSIKGSGTKTTQSFTAAGAWDLSYTYDCSNFGGQGNFQVMVYNNDGSLSFENAPVNELGASGSDVEHYHTGGTFYLEVNSECSWSVTVKG
jgi:hypothetical protein